MKDYLGDAVYVEYDGYHVILTTSDGINTTNTIMMEMETLAALARFVERVKEADNG